ncbi:hypothetical protein M4V62_10160 [Streptomyces durmitorensis]|uniref:SnoaL-like domain-containing protein n=1 Tax=Streptomyces durmitorensis TaxID=319947 RepID=A0ABY4PR17_9ACTN|nr:hypothetical protein [Streptomyces durmitorensis]UQT55428.1 hypothetical protein M4V62_10160 [Streptomyces durmitorensis]
MSLDVRDVLAPGAPDRTRLLLARDVVFHSPVADYSGRDDVAHLFPKIGECLTGIEPLREFTDPGTGSGKDGAERQTVTTFTADVGEESVYGTFVQQVDANGQLTEATLLLRPLHTLTAAVSRMRDALSADPLPSRR